MFRRFSPVALLTLLAALLIPTSRASAEPVQHKIDPSHSSVMFKSRHADTGNVWGRFNKFSGTITYDPSDPSKLAVEANVDVTSIDTANADRDKHLKSADFFSAKEFPTITFKSTSAKSAGGDSNTFEVTGDLTLHGQTKSVTITLKKLGATNTPQFGDRVGWEGTFTVKRSEFGMGGMPQAIGDDVQLIVSVEAVKPK